MPALLPIRLACATALIALMSATALGQDGTRERTSAGTVEVETVAQGLSSPWGLAFLPDGRMLVTERAGKLRLVARSGTVSAPVGNVPPVFARGQGGLLDVALAPDFADSRLVYLAYAEPREGAAGTSVARGRLKEEAGNAWLENVEVIFRQLPAAPGGSHFGSRLVFGRDGTLFVTLGDRQSERDSAQRLSTHIGKVVRINPDGDVPADNPFVKTQGARPEIWSYGHRNVQGAALDPRTGRLWTVEHGPRGGDELNHPEAGKNYGWPIVTYGREYSGGPIGEGTEKAGMEPPVRYWVPSISPSGLAFYDGTLFPAWKGDLFAGALSGTKLVRLKLDVAREQVVEQEDLLAGLGVRVRDVVAGPDGALWLLTDDAADGRLLRLAPAD